MSKRGKNERQVVYLSLLAAGMFGFAFALVPLYDVFCEITGLNGKTSADPVNAVEERIESDRAVTIQFTAQVARGLPWEFRPTESGLKVTLGEIYTTEYYVRNRGRRTIVGQAVPSVAPGYAATHLRKVECFCFQQQRLAPDTAMLMPVQFYIAADLPEEVSTLTLSYTMFGVDSAEPEATATPADRHDDDRHHEGGHEEGGSR